MQPLFRKEKDLYKLMADPQCAEKLSALKSIAEKMQESTKRMNERAKDLTDWLMKVSVLLPENLQDNKELREDLVNLVAKYDIENKQSESNT